MCLDGHVVLETSLSLFIPAPVNLSIVFAAGCHGCQCLGNLRTSGGFLCVIVSFKRIELLLSILVLRTASGNIPTGQCAESPVPQQRALVRG